MGRTSKSGSFPCIGLYVDDDGQVAQLRKWWWRRDYRPSALGPAQNARAYLTDPHGQTPLATGLSIALVGAPHPPTAELTIHFTNGAKYVKTIKGFMDVRMAARETERFNELGGHRVVRG